MQGGAPPPLTFLAGPSAPVAGMTVNPFGFFVRVVVQSRMTFIANGDQLKHKFALDVFVSEVMNLCSLLL
jgi:hypothetical protein